MMDRLDYEYQSIFGTGIRKRLKKKPSAYFEGDNLWFSMELEERRGLKYTIDAIGSERLFYASDYPHEPKEGEMKHELEEFLEDEIAPARSPPEHRLQQRDAVLQTQIADRG